MRTRPGDRRDDRSRDRSEALRANFFRLHGIERRKNEFSLSNPAPDRCERPRNTPPSRGRHRRRLPGAGGRTQYVRGSFVDQGRPCSQHGLGIAGGSPDLDQSTLGASFPDRSANARSAAGAVVEKRRSGKNTTGTRSTTTGHRARATGAQDCGASLRNRRHSRLQNAHMKVERLRGYCT